MVNIYSSDIPGGICWPPVVGFVGVVGVVASFLCQSLELRKVCDSFLLPPNNIIS